MLDTHEKRPLYLQLTDALLKQIVDEYQADDKLPTEMASLRRIRRKQNNRPTCHE